MSCVDIKGKLEKEYQNCSDATFLSQHGCRNDIRMRLINSYRKKCKAKKPKDGSRPQSFDCHKLRAASIAAPMKVDQRRRFWKSNSRKYIYGQEGHGEALVKTNHLYGLMPHLQNEVERGHSYETIYNHYCQ